jgi:hypothetical protein
MIGINNPAFNTLEFEGIGNEIEELPWSGF